MITIVYCHPQTESFNRMILNYVTGCLENEGRSYDVIDLYAANFNPVLSADDLKHYAKGLSTDPLVKRYTEVLQKTTEIIFIFPIWWGMMPAIMKGFIDKTFLKGIIYDTTPEGALMPCLAIDKTILITTSEADSELFGNFMMGYFNPMVLANVGMTNAQWLNFDHSSQKTDKDRNDFLSEILKVVAV